MRRLRRTITAPHAAIMRCLHQLADWPKFRWNDADLAPILGPVGHRQGRLVGRMEALGYDLRSAATLRALTEEVVKSSDIEGEILNDVQVRSSLARRLGLDVAGLVPS
ncbi:MAG TPA: DUF4172 domain-containing protein, partial [Polyangia bacterium]|nr:DUF4172 domain-containing protein [Polyangia bacterium]